MSVITDIKTFLEKSATSTLLDVRSPSEYSRGHIPGALNLPLFQDGERALIGTIYKKHGREEAISRGFEIVAGRYLEIISAVERLDRKKPVLLYCWRGGMRSASVAWLLKIKGYSCLILEGGYKSYRGLIRGYFSTPLNLKILGGMTGCGKTEILNELRHQGEQVVDLESLANHKGSAFGSLGERDQPTNEHFENLVLSAFLNLDAQREIWLEDESRNIGKVIVPPELYEQMRSAGVYYIDLNRRARTLRLIKDYADFPDELLIDRVMRIYKKLGGQNASAAIEAIQKKDYRAAIEIVLGYYDKTYLFGLNKRNPGSVVKIRTDSTSARENASLLLKHKTGDPHGNFSNKLSLK